MFRLRDFLEGIVGISISHTGEYAAFVNYLYQNDLAQNTNLRTEKLGVNTMTGGEQLQVYFIPRKLDKNRNHQPLKYEEIISMSEISAQVTKSKLVSSVSLKSLIAQDKAQYAVGGTHKFVFIPTLEGKETQVVCINLDTKENVELDDTLVTPDGVELDKLYTLSSNALLKIMSGKKISAENLNEEDFHLVWERSELDKFALEIAKLEAELADKKAKYAAMSATKKANK